MPEGLVLAFDFGLKWIGVATGQTITTTATPLTTLKANNGKPLESATRALISEWRPVAKARSFASWLATLTDLPVELVDERLSTREAINRRGKPRTGKPDDPSHAEAACVIAETWLNG